MNHFTFKKPFWILLTFTLSLSFVSVSCQGRMRNHSLPKKQSKRLQVFNKKDKKVSVRVKPALSAKRRSYRYEQAIVSLKKKLPKGFSFVVEPPFLVAGDEPISMIRTRAHRTIRWSVRHLKKLYFAKDPKRIITIWLFRDKASYQKYTKRLFNEDPGTPYGYYSEQHNALIMNIATGGGTLVHEIVHPFMASNFPSCPAWLNEGMGSLYEQCGESNGRIKGYTNWRLAGLQSAIRKKTVPSFKSLTATSENQFYSQDPGTNYSQSRYLLYYLQEKDLLVSYFRLFFRNRKSDPTGFKSLQEILGEKDIEKFQKHWESWVLKLRYRS